MVKHFLDVAGSAALLRGGASDASSNLKYDEARVQFYAKAIELDPKFGIGYQGPLAALARNQGRKTRKP